MAARKTARRTAKPVDSEIDASFSGATNAFESASETARAQFEQIFSAFSGQAETARDTAADLMETVRNNFETAQSRLKTVNAELMTAAREEISDAVDFANELARARTITDALEIQRGYWTKLFETRVERARGFASTSVEAARETIEPFSKTLASSFSTTSFERFFPVVK